MNEYFTLIETEKQWSWSIIVLVYFILGLLIRHLIMRKTFIAIKHLPRETVRYIRAEYSSQALFGWIFFVLALIVLTLSWMDLPVINHFVSWVTGQWSATVLYVFSVLLHQKACTHALLKFMDDRMLAKRDI